MHRSQFVTFLLSMFPGLGHLYLGLPLRAFGFMAAFFGWVFVLFGLGAIGRMHGTEVLLFLAPLPVIWFYSVFDALILNQRLNDGEDVRNRSPIEGLTESIASGRKDTMWALLFGVVPGAGQMYLGWQDRGLQIMLLFFLSMALVDWLRLSLFMFLLPVIWFYSYFDTMQLASGSAGSPGPGSGLLGWIAEKQRWVGLGLIALGLLVVFDRIAAPLLDRRVIEMARTAAVAALFIGGGVRLALGRRVGVEQRQPGEVGDGVASGDDESGVAKTCDNGE